MLKLLSHSHVNGSNKKLTAAKLNGVLPELISCQAIDIYARKTNFKKRTSDFDFISLYKDLLLTTGNSSNTFSISKSRKCYNTLASEVNRMEDKPFYNRVRQGECLDFTATCFRTVLSKIVDTI